MTKKITTLVLACAIVGSVLLTGCNTKDKTDSSTSTPINEMDSGTKITAPPNTPVDVPNPEEDAEDNKNASSGKTATESGGGEITPESLLEGMSEASYMDADYNLSIKMTSASDMLSENATGAAKDKTEQTTEPTETSSDILLSGTMTKDEDTAHLTTTMKISTTTDGVSTLPEEQNLEVFTEEISESSCDTYTCYDDTGSEWYKNHQSSMISEIVSGLNSSEYLTDLNLTSNSSYHIVTGIFDISKILDSLTQGNLINNNKKNNEEYLKLEENMKKVKIKSKLFFKSSDLMLDKFVIEMPEMDLGIFKIDAGNLEVRVNKMDETTKLEVPREIIEKAIDTGYDTEIVAE